MQRGKTGSAQAKSICTTNYFFHATRIIEEEPETRLSPIEPFFDLSPLTRMLGAARLARHDPGPCTGNGTAQREEKQKVIGPKCGLATLALLVAGAGCAIGAGHCYVNAEAWGANYTEQYIHRFEVQNVSGTQTYLEGGMLRPFSKGGTGGVECCALVPGVGQSVRVTWYVGAYNDDDDKWEKYSSQAVVKGSTSMGKGIQSGLIVRIFPGKNIEAEFFPMDTVRERGLSSRVDQLFYGKKVSRSIGE